VITASSTVRTLPLLRSIGVSESVADRPRGVAEETRIPLPYGGMIMTLITRVIASSLAPFGVSLFCLAPLALGGGGLPVRRLPAPCLPEGALEQRSTRISARGDAWA
jgi:hypothetical protein